MAIRVTMLNAYAEYIMLSVKIIYFAECRYAECRGAHPVL
jgi:hypothetical protein